MIRILLHGANGRMGQAIVTMAADSCNCDIVAGVDGRIETETPFPVYRTLEEVTQDYDVIIDFSTASAVEHLLSYAVARKKPVVVATTGLTDEQQNAIHTAAQTIPVFFSANMSLGINLLIDLVKRAASALGEGYDIEIIEKHHNQKLDAPSGTALSIANAISDVEPSPMEYVYDRHAVRKKRDRKEIGISSVRGGSIVGEHEVIFAGQNEVIEIKHQAASRCVFAEGALRAAVFLCDKDQGLYTMRDFVK